MTRAFTHPDLGTRQLQVVGPRVYSSGVESMRDSDADAIAHANKKVRELLRRGYTEGAPRSAPMGQSHRVVPALATVLNFEGKPLYPLAPVDGTEGLYSFRNVSVEEWWLVDDSGTCAVFTRSKIHGVTVSEEQRAQIASSVLATLAQARAEVFAGRDTPLRRFPLIKPAGSFDHVVVVSPETCNFELSGSSLPPRCLSRSVMMAFPAHAVETIGDETSTIAAARTQGRGCIPYANWARAPHPVVDLAKVTKPVKQGSAERTFLVHPPSAIDALVTVEDHELHVRNHAGDIRSFVRGDRVDREALRAFVGLPPGPGASG